MKIVMLCDFFHEALEYQENLLAKYYVKHGHEVTIITSTFESVFDYYNDRHDKQAPTRSYEFQGARVFKLRYRVNLMNRFRPFTSIGPILDQAQPDLIYVHDIIPNMLEAVAYKKRHPNCRMILDYHADYSNSGKNWLSLKVLHGVLRKWVLDRARPHLSRIFPIVPAGATFLNEVYHVPLNEMEVLPLGADSDLGREISGRSEGKALRERLGRTEHDLVLFTGGKLAPAKRTELLIEAVKRLANPAVHLYVVGEVGDADIEYKRHLLQLSSGQERIHFVGWLGKEDIYRYLDMADLAVFPASQSILWQQAISMGLPLVVGDSGHQDISYLNLHNNIVILKAGEITAEDLTRELRRLLGSPAVLQEMRRGAAKVAAEHLDWNHLIQRTLRFN